jgi:hypothetical protein
MSKIIDHQISKHFKGKRHFDRDTLIFFLTDLNPEFTESALKWRIVHANRDVEGVVEMTLDATQNSCKRRSKHELRTERLLKYYHTQY